MVEVAVLGIATPVGIVWGHGMDQEIGHVDVMDPLVYVYLTKLYKE